MRLSPFSVAEVPIASNCLWPQTYIATAAVTNLAAGNDDMLARSRRPEIMGDAAAAILTRPAAEATGNCYIDADVLTEAGRTDLSGYGGGDNPILDLFLDAE